MLGTERLESFFFKVYILYYVIIFEKAGIPGCTTTETGEKKVRVKEVPQQDLIYNLQNFVHFLFIISSFDVMDSERINTSLFYWTKLNLGITILVMVESTI